MFAHIQILSMVSINPDHRLLHFAKRHYFVDYFSQQKILGVTLDGTSLGELSVPKPLIQWCA